MNIRKIGLVFGAVSSVAIAIMFLSFMLSDPIVHNEIKIMEKRVKTLVPLGDADPGDNSGFFYFMIYPHQATPIGVYDSNLSNASAYEYSDVGNTTATGETPYSTAFDIVVKAGVTNEDGYWTGNQSRNPAYNWMLLTCADLSIGADTNMSEIFIANTTTYAWYHYYLNNSGSGYTISEGEYFNITSVKFYVQRIQ